MRVTRTRRLHRAGGVTAVLTAAAVSAPALPAHAAHEGRITGSAGAGSVGGSYIVTLKAATKAPSKAGRAVATTYGARTSHTCSTALNGYAVRAGERQARRLAADPRVASVARDATVSVVADPSLGGPPDPRLDAAVRDSIASGVTYTVAAGNDDGPADLVSPARVEEANTVGASDRQDARAYFSNWGARLDLFAPGVDVTSASHSGDSGTAAFSGTSMASPHGAGAVAPYLADHPSATPAEVGEALVDRAAAGELSDVGPASPDKLLQVSDF
ncbi:S8 family serine peptidase [Streptomyces ortus]|uniref:S8 family serine peptidase n=1 Tax=Streptomyces ortus TaxID=2867268 RepID=A0ABT3V3F5_9ACTN|nr:S8 family serine peptidase [Streptomyces ortus]MCX4234539.1 S8 family serine peptidase [Streptomyces ortus]